MKVYRAQVRIREAQGLKEVIVYHRVSLDKVFEAVLMHIGKNNLLETGPISLTITRPDLSESPYYDTDT